MDNDPLAKYRKVQNPLARKTEQEPQEKTVSREYEAYDPKDAKRLCMDIRLSSGDIVSPTWQFLLSVDSDGAGREVTLLYTFCIVKIQGRNLQKVADAIRARKTVFVQEYDPAKFPPPQDGQAVIEKIEVIRGGGER